MSTTTTYKVISNNAPVKNRPSLFASTLDRLKKSTIIEVISISGVWAYFKYKNKNAYILTYYLEKIETAITGSIIIRYLNVDTNEEISPSTTNNSLELKSYSYTAPSFNNYTIIEPSTKSVTLTSSSTNQELIFYYKENKLYGSVTVNCMDKDTNEYINYSNTYQNLELGTYTYTSPEIKGYKLVSESSISVTLTKESLDITITFEYIKILGSVTVKYIDTDTQSEISTSDIYSNLTTDSYTYKAKSIDKYTLMSDDTQTVTLTDVNYNQIILFIYKANEESKPLEPYDETKIPYIATKYLEPTFDINEDVIINLYASDWDQSDVVYEDTDTKFTLYMYVNEIYKEFNILIGDNSINVGKLDEGNYELLLQVCDAYGRKSHQLYNEFRVINKEVYDKLISENTYTITDNDLLKYDIDKNNNEEKAYETKIGIQLMINDLATSGIRKAILPKGEYIIKIENMWSAGNEVEYVKNPIFIPSNFILDLNGSTIKSNITPWEQNKGLMIAIDHAYDSHVINGILEGDYGKRDLTQLSNGYPSGEHLACATISGGSRYCSFENLTVKKFCGYALQAGISPITGGSHAITQSISNWTQGSINKNGELDSSILGKYTCDYMDLSVFETVNTLRSGNYLGYQYNPEGNSWIVEYHFYDSSKNYISTIIGHQYRDFKKPSNASYLRCTYSIDDSSGLSGIMIMHNYFPRNCQFKNISFEDTRTCALAPFQGNNILIDNCTFTRCATNITPVAIDFEDGWHNMQDYCIQNCEILEAVGTGDLVIVGGLNLLFRNNINWRVSSRGCARGQVFENNLLTSFNLGLNTHLRSAYAVCKNNNFTGYVGNGLGTLDDVKLVIYNCIFKEISYQNSNENIIVKNCNFYWNSKSIIYAAPILGGTYYNCKFYDYICEKGHIGDFYGYNCEIYNMSLAGLQGGFYLDNCKVDNCSFSNYTKDIQISIINNSSINNFVFNYASWAKCNIYYNAINSTFNNIIVRNNILDDKFAYFDSSKKFIVYTFNNTYINKTVIANEVVLNNSNINFNNIIN